MSLARSSASTRGFRARLSAGLIVVALGLGKLLAADQDWPNVGGDKGCQRYSTLDQINRRNVSNLQVAWTYHAGDAGKGTTIECTPIVIERVQNDPRLSVEYPKPTPLKELPKLEFKGLKVGCTQGRCGLGIETHRRLLF